MLVAFSLAAQHQAISAKTSKIEFSLSTKTQPPARITGRLQPVTGNIDFDQNKLARSHITISGATTGLTTGDPNMDKRLRDASFFGVTAFPALNFTSTSIIQDRPGSIVFIAQGNLTIKGITRPAKIQFTVSPASKGHIFRCTAFVSRTAYGIGEKGEMDELMTLFFEIRTS